MADRLVYRFARTEYKIPFGEAGDFILVALFLHGIGLNHEYRSSKDGRPRRVCLAVLDTPGDFSRQPISFVNKIIWMHS